jgi:hypothetical protein
VIIVREGTVHANERFELTEIDLPFRGAAVSAKLLKPSLCFVYASDARQLIEGALGHPCDDSGQCDDAEGERQAGEQLLSQLYVGQRKQE